MFFLQKKHFTLKNFYTLRHLHSNALPHSKQKRAPSTSARGEPQCGHTLAREVPQKEQYCQVGSATCWQDGQCLSNDLVDCGPAAPYTSVLRMLSSSSSWKGLAT